MLYHLSEYLSQFSNAGPLRLTRYISFRAIFAMLTAFLITLLIGRLMINFLYRRKIRDIVRDYSVMSVDSKSGTPTMGGLLMFIAILSSVLIWSNLLSPFTLYLLMAMFWFAAVGAYDDYLKIRYKNSDKGLSRSKKYLSQIGYAVVFGVLFLHPATSPLPHPDRGGTCQANWPGGCSRQCSKNADCQNRACGVKNSFCRTGLCRTLPCKNKDGKAIACSTAKSCKGAGCGNSTTCAQPWQVQFPGTSKASFTFRPSQLYIPFYTQPVMDMSWLYLLVIIFMIVYAANAVNFADGLDGLATIPALFSYLVYAIYAYILGNAIMSKHLLFPMLPGAGEAAVFCAAIAGAGLGFLWFNAYPAEVFMGDTGSIMLGGVLGTLMVLLKQEVLFFLVGGIFLVELFSVMIQDWLGIKVLGRRLVFRAPIHHTYQHRGISEPKIVVRFWIVSGMLALLAIAALKIR